MDHICPTRSGGWMPLVNEVARETGQPAAEWSAARILSMTAGIVREARERKRQAERQQSASPNP